MKKELKPNYPTQLKPQTATMANIKYTKTP